MWHFVTCYVLWWAAALPQELGKRNWVNVEQGLSSQTEEQWILCRLRVGLTHVPSTENNYFSHQIDVDVSSQGRTYFP